MRLAQMDDKLDKLARPTDSPELAGDNLLSELSDW
jgi:hypothetical protein